MKESTKQFITSVILTIVSSVMWVFLAYKFLEMLCR